MYQDGRIIIGKAGDKDICLATKMVNRHGMIAGATGTGKTTTVKALAQDFSAAGVPVFLADVKGDLGGMCDICPVTFWDLYGKRGLPLRTTVSEMGPILLARILGLTDTQSDVLRIVFKIADDEGLLLIDTKDLRAMLNYAAEKSKDYALEYGAMSKQSLAAIVRAVVSLEAEGGELFFGEPALSIGDWLQRDPDGRGQVQILDARELIRHPLMYSAFMLWLVSELFESLPEVGDLERPKAVFFFDEAHLLFNNAPRFLIEKLEQMVKLIRSKGVGIYFISQSPGDIPGGVLAQLGNKIQHALHAYTPSEQKAAKAAASSFRVNPEFDTYETLTSLGIGEALISFLQEDGSPSVVERTAIMAGTMTGAIDDERRDREIKASLLYSKYMESFDRDSAYEFLMRLNMENEARALKEAEEAAAAKEAAREEAAAAKAAAKEEAAAARAAAREEAAAAKAAQKQAEAAAKEAAKKEQALNKEIKRAAQSTAKTTAGTVGREVGHVMGQAVGGKFGKTLGGNIGASLGRGLLSTLFKLGK